jgi:hypothetical protein
MKNYIIFLILFISLFTSCEEFLEIDPPKNQLVGEYIFEETATVDGAFAHIYTELRESAFTTGTGSGISYLLGCYADELNHLSEDEPSTRSFFNNSVLPSNYEIAGIWNSSYKLIYDCNKILEGVENSNSLTLEDKNRFIGEAYFIRAFIHFHLANLFGDIPFLDTTDYRENTKTTKLPLESVYELSVLDLISAKKLLYGDRFTMNKFRPNYWTASALLARIYLYSQSWDLAKEEAVHIISEGPFALEKKLDEVFLIESKETLWHLDSGTKGNNTYEGRTFFSFSAPPSNTAMSNDLLDSFEEGDMRFIHWVGAISGGDHTWYYPFKYKQSGPTDETLEYSVLFRLPELYFIAAEASAQMGQSNEALIFLNKIRTRASLPALSFSILEELLESILHERRIELFSEQGHRFFDLKRTGNADDVLSKVKSFWDETDKLLPLPEDELLKNPNLLPQNNGY